MDTTWLEGFFSLDQTTICVFLIVLSVSILWIYVTVFRGKVEPNFDALYEKSTPPAAGNKKSLKTKVKSKPLEGSPRPNKAKPGDEAGPAPLQVKEVTSKKESLPKKQATHKTPSTTKKQAGKKRSQDEMKDNTQAVESELAKENEGEWQTQLSRPQLRALRQKQKKSIETGHTASQSGVDVGSDSNGDPRQSEREVGSRSVAKGRRKNKGKEEGKGSPELKLNSMATSTDDAKETTQLSDLSGPSQQEVSSANGELPPEGAKVEGSVSSVSAPVTCNSSILDLESALREAAFGSASVNKHETPSSQEETEAVKVPQKRKKAKRKNKQEEDSDSKKSPVSNDNERPPSAEQEDDWVVID